jgi:Transposase IS116/IS110/IS902 family
VLHRNLKPRPPMTDAFGVAGRKWLQTMRLPDDERDTINAALRQIDFLTHEISTLERDLARYMLESPDARRLMTVPGVGMTTATVFLAAVGDIARFPAARRLVGYLGLDPRVRRSGNSPAHTGRISKRAPPRSAMCSSKRLTAIRSPGPLKAFYERTRARRGHQIAIVATARQMAILFGTCSAPNATTPTRCRPRPPRKSAASNSKPGPHPASPAGPENRSTANNADKPNAPPPRTPRPPTNAPSPTGTANNANAPHSPPHLDIHPSPLRRPPALD